MAFADALARRTATSNVLTQVGGTGVPSSTASGFSATMLLPALTGLLGAGSAAEDIRTQSRVTVANIKAAGKALVFSQHSKGEQLKELDRVIGDKLSASGLETLKREARLRTAAAETGVAGTSTEEAIGEAYMEENFRTAAIMREADINKHSLKQSMVADLLQFESDTSAMVTGMRSPSSTFLTILGAGISGFNTGLSFMTQADRDRLLGVDQGTPT